MAAETGSEGSDGQLTPGAEDETGGDTEPGVEDETGSETDPEAGEGTDGETNPGTGGETDPGAGEGTDGETNPGDGEETDGETNPDDGEGTGGETDPDDEEETDGETDLEEEEEIDDLETETEEGKLSALGSAREAEFVIDSNGTLTAYNGTGGDVTIPDTVTAIGSNVFKGNVNITGVTIPGTVLTIGEAAFSGCTKLVEVNLNTGLTTIEKGAFDGVPFGGKELSGAITGGSLTIPGSVTSIGAAAFKNSEYLETVTFENGSAELTMSSNYAAFDGEKGVFRECKALKSVTLPDQLKVLPNHTFYGCTALEEVKFGIYLETIGDRAYSDCSSLLAVEMPTSLKSIGEDAFSGCTGLVTVKLNAGLETIGKGAFDGVAFGSKDMSGAITGGSLTIPGSVTSIGAAAFKNSEYLETVTFENGSAELTMSSNYAAFDGEKGVFRECKALKSVTLPDQLKVLPNHTFYGCTALEEVKFGIYLETIGDRAYSDCSSLLAVEMPTSLKSIGEDAFSGCTGLVTVKLNAGLETIGKGAFDGVAFGSKDMSGAITGGSLTIPGSVTSIGAAAFKNSEYLETVTFENGSAELTMSSNYAAFDGEKGVFRECKALKSVTLPDQLKVLPNHTFYGCTALEEVKFGIYLETIGDRAYSDCSSLLAVEMPTSLKSIGEDAFSGCTGLVTVKLNAGLETIGKGAFDGVAFGSKDMSGAITGGSLTIPGSVTSIGAAAFKNSEYLETVTFENGSAELTMSSNYAAFDGEKGVFRECKALKSVTLPDQLKVLPNHTFYGCTALEEVEFGIYLESIGEKAFAYCSGLQWVYLPESLKTIEAEAFAYCAELTAIYIPKTVTVIRNRILQDSPKAVIYGVSGSTAETYAKENGIPFREEGELERSVTGISLNRSRITLAGEEAIGSTVLLRATVRPATAQNKRVNYTSDNEEVAAVDSQGKVTVKGYGTATVTAAAQDESNGKKTATCQITVIRAWTEEEKEMIGRKLQEANAAKLTVVTNICETVKEIDLDCPAGLELQSAEWRLPYSISEGEENYDVVVKKDGYQDAVIKNVTITGIAVEGIEITGAARLQNGRSTVLTAKVLTTGGELPADSYEMEWETPSNSGVSLTKNPDQDTVTVTGVSNKTATVTGYLLLKKDGKPAARVSGLKNKQWFSAAARITVTGEAVADRIVISAADKDGQAVEISSLKALADTAGGKEYRLTAQVYTGETQLTAPILQWKSTNTKVAEVRGQGETATLIVKEKGAAVISVSAAKNGGYTETFRVVVKDSTPRLEESSVTLNLNQVQPTAVIHISPSDGYAVAEDTLTVTNEGGSGSAFTIRKIEGTKYQIGIKEGTSVSTGKQKVSVQMKTSAGEQEAHRLPLTISVSRQVPKVTITQESVNLYEKEAQARVSVSAEEEIEQILYTPSAGSGPRLVLTESNPEEGYFMVKAEGQTSGNYKNTSARGTLQVIFKGYKAEAAYKKALTIKVNKKLPAIQASAANTVLYPEYPETGLDTTTVSFRLKANGQELFAEEGWRMELSGTAPAGVTVTPGADGQPLTVTFGKAAKNSATLKFAVRNEKWNDQSGVKVSCTIKKGKTPEMGFSNNKVVLNKEYDLSRYEPVRIDLFVKNHPGRRIARISSITGKDARAEAAKDAGFVFTFDEGSLKAGIRNKDHFSGNTKYTYLIKGADERGIPVSGSLQVTVSTADVKVTCKQSGSIDLLDREGTQIICKPSIKNYTDTIEKVDLYGSYAERFSAVCEDGNIVIKAKEGRVLKAKTTYKLFLKIGLASGVDLTAEVKVTPKQSNPKLAQNLKKTVLFEASYGESCGREIEVWPAKDNGTEISDIELTNGGDTFGYTYTGDGKGTLYVLETASQKVNKTYKLKLAVRFKDGAANATPAYVTVSVNYKK